MARKPAPTKAHPEPRSTKPAAADEHPALALFHALNALHTVCSHAGAFRELAERRERAWARQLNFLNLRAKLASDRANELARAGAPMEEQWAAQSEGMDRETDPPPSNERAEHTKYLREEILDHGRTLCERARAALRAGGAKGLDAATQPDAAGQARSIELHTKLQDAERVFVGLTIGVGDPRIIIDKDAASMADLGAWFARTRDEMRAVIETRGLDAPAPKPTVLVLVSAPPPDPPGARHDGNAPAAKFPELKAHDRQAWQLATLHGMTQNKVASELNKEHGTTYTQGQVSRMIARATAHATANGLAEKVAGPIDRPRTVDPGRLELGARVDKRKPRPSDLARVNDDDE